MMRINENMSTDAPSDSVFLCQKRFWFPIESLPVSLFFSDFGGILWVAILPERFHISRLHVDLP
jgi:hypothetical protein